MASPRRKFPRCVFALGSDSLNAVLTKDLSESGIEAVFAKDEASLIETLSAPECFAVFVNLRAFPAASSVLRQRESVSKCYWVAIEERLTTSQSAALYNMGVVDVLTLPVHPFTYRSRARQLLARFVKSHWIPDDILLPQGMFRPTTIIPERTKTDSGRGSAGRVSPDVSTRESSSTRPSVSLANHSGVYGKHRASPERVKYFEKARPSLAPLRKVFEQVSGAEIKQRFMKEAQGHGHSALLWIARQKWKSQFEILSYDPSVGQLALKYPRGLSAQSLKLVFSSLKAEKLFASIALKRARLFFFENPNNLSFAVESLVLKSSAEMFQTQRRSHFRLRWDKPGSFRVLVAHEGAQILRDYVAVDISANGCQLIMGEAALKSVARGTVFPRVCFNIYGNSVECSGVVRWKKDDRVGIQFYNLGLDDEEGIQLFVMEESYNYLKEFVVP